MSTLELTDEPTPEPLFDAKAPLRPSGNLRRREMINRLASGGAIFAALLAIAVLAVVIYTVAKRGLSSVSFAFVTQAPSITGGGGIAPELVGTIIIVALATAIAAPIGILTALFLTEYANSRVAHVIRTLLDLMQGLPSIIVGVVVFGILVVGSGQSGYAASVALAIIMLPLVARSSQEVILLVPNSLREAADALGVNRWRTIWGVILPEARAGIVTGTILAVARAAGETAPLVLICSVFNPGAFSLDPFAANHALPNVPVYIFTLSEAADPTSFGKAWGAALVLLTLILIANIGARFLLARSTRKSGR